MIHHQFSWGGRCVPILLGGLLILGNGCDSDAPDATASAKVDPNPGGQPEEEVEVEQSDPIDTMEVSNEIAKIKQGKKGKALHDHLDNRGFKASGTAKKDLYGQRTRYKDPDKPNVKHTHTIVLQNYQQEGSSDAGALASVTITTTGGGPPQTTTYDFALIAEDGNPDMTTELTATEEGTVVEANSWYSCLRTRITQKCGGACITALGTCWATTWAGYLECLAISCGGCLVACTGCCSCDCSWWCRWGVGCCDR
jgi:hypothetical protein